MSVLNYCFNDDSRSGVASSAKNGIDKNKILAGTDAGSGWKVFKSEFSAPAYGTYTNIYIATIYTLSQKNSYKEFLGALERNSGNGVFFKSANIGGNFDFSVDEYSVFSFALEGNETPLSEIHPRHKKILSMRIFEALLKIIYDHSTSQMCAGRYVPLNMINEENIYLCQDRDRVRIKILPMPMRNFSDDVRYSRNSESSDVSVDVFDAVYLYMRLRYPGDEQIPDRAKDDLFIERCLLPIPKRRPTLEQLLKTFKINGASDPGFNYDDDIRRIPNEPEEKYQNNSNFDNTVETGSTTDRKDDVVKPEPENNLGELFSKIGKKVKKNISSLPKKAKDYVKKNTDNSADIKNDGTVE